MNRFTLYAGSLLALAAFALVGGGAAVGAPASKGVPAMSGAAEFRDVEFGTFITECPQAGRSFDSKPKPLDKRAKDEAEKKAEGGSDLRVNQDYACHPQDETAIDINPQDKKNIVAGANDYRLGTGSSGFYASTDSGKSWYDGIIPFPSAPANQSRGEGVIPSGGDPVIAFDRAGVVYYSMIGFYRGDDTNGVFVSRSTNGGFTWSRARIGGSNTPCPAPCPNTDPRQPGDGVVDFNPDNDTALNGSVPFNDKEWMTTGPRPTGVPAQCFTPAHAPTACGDPKTIGVDRIYVTWTEFNDIGSEINLSYSDDQGRSWSPNKVINGSAPFCVDYGLGTGNECTFDQGSVPTVNPTNGHLWVGFTNGNTPDENQYLVVRSNDGGATFTGPYFVTTLYDINYPRANATRPDCVNRGAQTRNTLTNSCFRVNSYANTVVDRRGGAFADDLYVLVDDNRNGTPASSNVDVFFLKSTDGGMTWIGPTRVNDDPSTAAPNRDCGRTPGFFPTGDVNTPCGGVGNFGNDQWFPWIDVSTNGNLNVIFHDRRLDVSSTGHEWPTSRQRPGNYLTWTFGAVCTVGTTATVPAAPSTTIPAGAMQCVAPEAVIQRQPTAPVDPGPNPVPGNTQSTFPFKNFQISDIAYNLDYSFRAGIFMGDYNNVAISDTDPNTAWGMWTDSRNGRSSGGPAGGGTNPSQPGRNPTCEQSDVFAESWNAKNGNAKAPKKNDFDDLFLVMPCPDDIKDKKSS